MHRTTPHCTNGVSPAEHLFRRKLQTRIPGIEKFQEDDQEVKDRDRDSEAKERGKLHADDKRRECESGVREGLGYCLNKNDQIK